MSEYAPGTVAVATVRGVENVRVMWDGVDWVGAKVHHSYEHGMEDVTDVRPLVVLDPEDDADVKRLCEAYRSVDHGVGTMPMQKALRALVRPPKPAEPTAIGSRVEEANGIRYTRFSDSEAHNDGDWINEDGVVVQWSAINAVRVLSKGWTA